MRVEYGPPGHKGVTQIMGLGGYHPVAGGYVPQDKPGRTVGLLAAATWALGVATGSSTAKNIGIGGVLAVVYVEMLKKPEPPPPPPTSTQGWG